MSLADLRRIEQRADARHTLGEAGIALALAAYKARPCLETHRALCRAVELATYGRTRTPA